MPEFPYRKASVVIAHAKLFTKNAAISFYSVRSGTYDYWRNRYNTDEKLQEMVAIELDKLANQWQGEAVRTLKNSLELVNKGIENTPFQLEIRNRFDVTAWANAMNSLSKVIKSVGDLTISTVVLNEEGDDEDE